MHSKIKSLTEIEALLEKERREGHKIVQCHGVFDLLHPGHIRHLHEAKRQGDKLVVTVTPDRFVNKGPGRPAFNEQFRVETLAALACVDYVVLNDTPDATSAIRYIHPNIYVKGIEYRDHASDVTGKIVEEVRAVEEGGGIVHYTDDIVFSSSALINRYVEPQSPELAAFFQKVKALYTTEEIICKIDALAGLKVLVIGDAIVDEYQYVTPLGQSGKGLHMVARCLEKEVFLGGSLIIANHIAQFAGSVTLVTSIGRNCPYQSFITTSLDPKVRAAFVMSQEEATLTKKRYVLKDGNQLSKLFETYSSNDQLLAVDQTAEVIDLLQEEGEGYDLIIACDFGNGFTNGPIIEAVCSVPTFLAINTQTNSGNRGFNVITHYRRADFISVNEPELRLAAHDRYSSIEEIVSRITGQLHCGSLCVTRGVQGVACFASGQAPEKIPALTSHVVDRVGAGDSFLALASLCLARKEPLMLAGLIGSLAAALDVQIIGNREPIKKAPLCKFLTRLMK